MRQFINFCLFVFVLSLAACQSIDVERFLNSKFCPQALVLKGAEIVSSPIEAELAELKVDCDVSFSGDLGAENFEVDKVEVEIDIRVRLRSPQTAQLPLFAVLLNRQNKQIVSRHKFTIKNRAQSWQQQIIGFTLSPKIARKAHRYIILIGFVVDKSLVPPLKDLKTAA